jgi:hypothetical protein
MNKAIEVATPVMVVEVSGGPAMERLLLQEWPTSSQETDVRRQNSR